MLRWSPTRLFDRYWAIVILTLAPAFAVLNLEHRQMQGIYDDYVCYRQTILDGFDTSRHQCESPTFPMWGDGWLLVLTRNEVLLLLLQNTAAAFAAWLFLLALERRGIVKGQVLRLVKALLVVSIPWYAFHSVQWPYSEAVSLVLVAVAILLLALVRTEAAYRWFVLSGLAFGVALNFRSDYILLPLLMAAAVVLLVHPRRLQLRRLALWLAAIALTLTPWMVYSRAATGNVLVTSTNGGHVLYISLGQLPGNPWGITPLDDDPRMHNELDAHFGRRGVSSLTYESDQFLRRRFVELVREHPRAYARKVAWNAWATITDGTYPGEFFEEKSCQPDCRKKYGVQSAGPAPWEPLIGPGFTLLERLRYLLFVVSVVESRLVAFAGFIIGALALVVALRRRKLPLLLVALLPSYQAAMNVFGYQLSSYNSNAYLPMLVLLGLGAGLASERLQARLSAPPTVQSL